jgi:hypothetical protein
MTENFKDFEAILYEFGDFEATFPLKSMRQNPRKITGGGTLRSDLEESRTCCDG